MHDPAPISDLDRIRGHRKDKSVLKYLREMVRLCRYHNRRWLRMDYERAWEFASQVIYGQLPPLEDYSTGQQPQTVRTKFPAGAARPPEPWPLKKVVKRFTLPWNGQDFSYETLECCHVIAGPVGWYAPVKRRRCIHCALAAAAQPKKKSAASASAVAIAKSNAVGA
jgi:hypothetical protein